jgi:hypothetical protein
VIRKNYMPKVANVVRMERKLSSCKTTVKL